MINMTEVNFGSRVFNSALYPLPEALSSVLSRLPVCVKNSAYEIRLRAEKPLTLTADHVFYVSEDAEASITMPRKPLKVTSEQLFEVLTRLTGHSVYTRAEELRNGYVSMKNGHRAGVCGRFQSGHFREISSVNIRIAREINGAAEQLYDSIGRGILIAGRPGSGKTTVLRDLVRHLSNSGKRISLIDTRGEIAAANGGRPTLDVGVNTDVISGGDKAKGVEIALRTLFPDYIAFDEIGTSEELQSVSESFFSGTGIITTAHADGYEELMSRNVTRKLCSLGAIEYIALLPERPGDRITVKKAEELCSKL